MNRGWFRNRVNDLVMLFPDISEELTVPLYDEAQADAICAFGEQWPQTRAAICSIILKGQFKPDLPRVDGLFFDDVIKGNCDSPCIKHIITPTHGPEPSEESFN
ncbi:hypothetical protein HPB52_016958 [Rhipicephalus sanguineus]|uniref:Uncharacterized protein n=1 Tax=Rhipicephalus sanguineus TaxID=34632 RepID=A0A9D4QF46_RHISA|nr:hypothetical protein HPB52_016958 [Rhipicephalus sanguineus]